MVADRAPWIFVVRGQCARWASLQRGQTVDRATINKRIDRAPQSSQWAELRSQCQDLTLAPRRPPDFPTSASLAKAFGEGDRRL
jgi:hypothetical protein